MGKRSASSPTDSSPKPPMAQLHIWQIQAVRDVLVVGSVVAIIWAGYAMRTVTVPLLVALVLAYLFEPLITKLTKNPKTKRPVVVGGLITTVGLLVVLMFLITIPLVINQTSQLAETIRSGRFQGKLLQLQQYLPENYRDDYEQMMGWLGPHPANSAPGSMAAATQAATQPGIESAPMVQVAIPRQNEDRLRELIREELAASGATPPAASGTSNWLGFVRSGGQAILDLLGTIISFSLLAFLIPFYFFFFSVSYPAVARFGRELIPVAGRPRTLELIRKMDRAVAGFVRGRIVICFLMGVMLSVGWMVVGVPYSIVVGMLVGALSIVPYLGGIGLPLAIGLLALNKGEPDGTDMAWWAVFVWPTVVFLIVQVIEGYILTPMIAGKATNLDPVTILVAVLAGGSVGGVYGMILAIPVAACLKILFTDVLLPRVRAWIKGEVQDPLPIARE